MADFSSANYWEDRYRSGGTSGAGSYNRLARFKAAFINEFVALNNISTVIEFGCGDGNQANQLRIPHYTGVDVSPTALARCRKLCSQSDYLFIAPEELANTSMADLTLSLDVIFHLVEDDVFAKYIQNIFTFALRYVIIYSSDKDASHPAQHVRHRHVSAYVRQMYPEWRYLAKIPNIYPADPARPDETSFADFMIFGREPGPCRLLVPALEI